MMLLYCIFAQEQQQATIAPETTYSFEQNISLFNMLESAFEMLLYYLTLDTEGANFLEMFAEFAEQGALDM